MITWLSSTFLIWAAFNPMVFYMDSGLLGMSSFVILERTTEIGIRKVIGASVGEIMVLLPGNLIRLIAIAFLISIPLTVIFLQQWLKDFVVWIDIFAAAGSVTLLVALFTISYQSFKAAMANRVDAIKQE